MRRVMRLKRREVLAGFILASASPARAAGSGNPSPGTLIVAGPPGGKLDRWADLLAPMVGQSLPGHISLTRRNIGGIDGVTGANQFEARGEPDGSTALLVPGAATLAWLTGETRAHFDPSRWVPLWAGASSTVLVSRVAIKPGMSLRVAAASPAGPALPMLLALDLMGVAVSLGPAHLADAMLLQDAEVPGALAASAQNGLQPALTLGVIQDSGEVTRDPRLPSIPTTLELVRNRAPPDLLAALRATGMAVQLEAGLVLPALTPAASVSLWRRASIPLLQDPDMLHEAARLGARFLPAETMASCTSGVASGPAMLLALRQWLATRYEWRST